MKKPLNRCSCCNKFKKFEELQIYNFVPDNEFSSEEIEYICIKCNNVESLNDEHMRKQNER